MSLLPRDEIVAEKSPGFVLRHVVQTLSTEECASSSRQTVQRGLFSGLDYPLPYPCYLSQRRLRERNRETTKAWNLRLERSAFEGSDVLATTAWNRAASES